MITPEPTANPLSFTNYQALTSDIVLAIASQALEDVSTTATLPASSSLIFEVEADNTIRGFLNDVEYVPAGCKDAKACTTNLFTAAIKKKVPNAGTLSELADACKSSEQIQFTQL